MYRKDMDVSCLVMVEEVCSVLPLDLLDYVNRRCKAEDRTWLKKTYDFEEPKVTKRNMIEILTGKMR